jgi:hypothetical protein
MPNFEQNIKELRVLFEREKAAVRERERLQKIGRTNPAFQDELDAVATEHISNWEKRINDKLEGSLRCPPHHQRHSSKLKEFYNTYQSKYENSIFIMTEFPEGNKDGDKNLIKVIDAVRASIREHKMCPCLASDHRYYPILWDNVELYMLGCSRGVAIVEDRYNPELNPNVAVEWGFMRGLGKDVLFLVTPWNGWQPCVPMFPTRGNKWSVTMGTTVTSLGEGGRSVDVMDWCPLSCTPSNHPRVTARTGQG